jgi:hypothetical protein
MSDRVFVVTPKVLRLRQAPSTGAAILARLLRGQLVASLDRTARGRWWRIFADTGEGGFVGYVDSSYLAPWSRAPAAAPANETARGSATEASS